MCVSAEAEIDRRCLFGTEASEAGALEYHSQTCGAGDAPLRSRDIVELEPSLLGCRQARRIAGGKLRAKITQTTWGDAVITHARQKVR